MSADTEAETLSSGRAARGSGGTGPHDVLIVGAGFAGLAAARAAASGGLRTLVVEAKPRIGARPHTSGILVEEAFQALRPPDALVRRVRKIRLTGPDRSTRAFEQTNYAFYTSDVTGLLQWMAREAQNAGAEIRVNAPFTRGVESGDLIEALIGPQLVRTRFLFGADGAKSPVARNFRLGLNEKFLLGVEREYSDAGRLDPDYLHLFLDNRIAPGYIGWAAAHPKGAQIGLAVNAPHRPRIEALKSEAEALFRLKPADEYERRSGLIPCGGLVHPWARGRVILLGDAAGMVSPLTAGGIRTALDFGRAAGEALVAHLRHNGPVPAAALRKAVPHFGALRHGLRWLADRPPPNWLLQMAVRSAPAAAASRRIFFSRRPR